MRRTPVIAAVLMLLAGGCEQGGEAEAQGREGPSGFPVPRYVSLRFDTVNARAGPSEEHRVVWTYRTRGLPVQVIAETLDWRRVCDPDGGVAWVHKRTTDGRRTALRPAAESLPLTADPRDGSEVRAVLAGRSVSTLDRCRDGWCLLRAGEGQGWTRASNIWGGTPGVQCRMPDQRQAAEPAPR